jgi:cellulose synthase operon protein C
VSRPVGAHLGCAVVLSLALAGCGGKSESDLLASAKQSVDKRDYASAAIDLKSALQKRPDLAEARYLLGVALMGQNNYPAALVELGKARDLNFDPEKLLPKLARCKLALGKVNDVLTEFGGLSLKSARGQAELKTAVAVAHGRLNQLAEAEAAVADALKADPAYAWAHLTQARLRAVAGKYDDALAQTEKAITPNEASGDAYLFKGLLLRYAKKDMPGAIKAFQLAAADPREALNARTSLIQAYLSQGKLADAKAELALLRKSHPKSPVANYVGAIVAYADKDYAQAEEIIDKLLRYAPDSPQFLVLGGAANLQRNNLLAAETKLGKVVQTVERMTVARKLLAETYLRMGQPEKSLNALRPLIEVPKPDADALTLAGQAYLQKGNAQDAEAMFSAAVRLKPNDAQVRTALALTDLVKGNADVAFEALQSIAASDPGETADLALISAHLRRREFDAALVAIDVLQKKRPAKALVSQLRGAALQGKGDLAGARSSFEAALKAEPSNFTATASLANLDLQEKKFDAAIDRLNKAIEANPQNTQARMALLDLKSKLKAKPEELLAMIEAAIKSAPSEAAPRVAKMVQLARMNDVKGAAAAAQDAMAALPDNPEVLDAAGTALANAGDEQQAISAFNKLSATAPRSPLPYIRIAEVHARRGDTQAAAASLSRAFEAAPESAEVHARLLTHAINTRNFTRVLAAAKDLQKRMPQSAMGYMLEGRAEAARKGWQAAIAAYRAAIGKSDADGKPQRLVHATLKTAGDAAGAERFASAWLRDNPKDLAFREYLGVEALDQRQYQAAQQLLQDVVAQQPRNAAATNNLAWVMAELGVPGAAAMAERAIKLAPQALAVRDTLAKALASEGRIDEAIKTQQAVVADAPAHPEFRLNLARLYAKAGKTGDAKAELDAVLKQANLKAADRAAANAARRSLDAAK